MVDKMKKNNMMAICIFTLFLLLAIVPSILALSPTSHTAVSSTNHTTISTINHKKVSMTKHVSTTPVVVSKNQCPCIAFRLDDVQEYYLSNVQTKLIDEFQKKNASLTIGIIGYDFNLDENLTSHIRDKLNLGHVPIEIANHGLEA